MENTGKLLFGDDTVPQWYVAQGDRWVGPMAAADVYQKVVSGEISWAHLVWKPGQAGWTRICDTSTFQGLVPQLPGQSAPKPSVKRAPSAEARKAATRAPLPPPPESAPEEPKEWYLYVNQGQYGPFSEAEMRSMLSASKIHPGNYVWKDGMANWQKVEKIAVFQSPAASPARGALALKAVPAAPARDERRGTPRKPIVAKIILAHEDSVIVGLCRDISIGGMQVLTDRIPGKPGSRLKLNISPSSGDKKNSPLKPFVAEGTMVRVLEDGRGFSFRFERISEKDRKAIQEFIDASS